MGAALKNPRKLALDSSSDSDSESGSSDSDDSSSGDESRVHSGTSDRVADEPETETDQHRGRNTAIVLCSPAMDTADLVESSHQQDSTNNLQSPILDTVDLMKGACNRENRSCDEVETEADGDTETLDIQIEMTSSASHDHQ